MSYKTTVDLLAVNSAKPVSCRIFGGQLLPELSPVRRAGKVADGILFAAHSEGAGRYFLCTDKEVYLSVNGESFIYLDPLEGNSPFMIEDMKGDKVRAVAVNGGDAAGHTGVSYSWFAYGKSLSCGVMHCGRMFGADSGDGFRLLWSGEGGISDWQEGINGSGSFVLNPARGVILDIAEYGEKLVAVRKYGLTLLNMFGAPENFSVDITNTDTDEIFKRTAQTVGGKLLFYTASGLHSFDGSQIKKIEHRLAEDISSPVCSAVYAGRYYLSCKSKTLGGGGIMCYDPDGGESWLINVQADAMCCSDKLYIYNSDGVYRLETGGEYSYECTFGFGTGGEKTVTEIIIDGGAADVEISNGRVSRRFADVSGIIRPRLRGKKFTVKVKGKDAVYGLSARAEARREI